ncbi:cell adhesion molecule 3-like isoform X3 [Pelmatolapia mariae]|uniref:cell adhesion molecule 3-like isoform X3 n=1 Tax=Pelmatolapia mariae TaxID=158779 RepID=UPI002FE65C8B
MDGAASFCGSFCHSIPSICDSALLRVLLVTLSLLCADVEALQVIGGSVTVEQGSTAILSCYVTGTNDDLTQITWQRRTREKPHNDNFLTIFPRDGPLFVNGVPPFTNVKDNLPTFGIEEVLFATCTAAGSRPPAEVKWLTGALTENVRTTTNSTQHNNGTTTTVSSLFGVPMREINGHQVQCVISGDSLSTERSLPFTIQVYFSPTEVNIRVISEDSFECVTEAKPNANFIWSRSGQSLLESSVKVDGAKLQLLSLTSALNGLYQCEASNTYGSKRGHLYVHVASGVCSVAWALLGVLIFLSIVGAAVWYFYTHEDQSLSHQSEHSSNFRGLIRVCDRREPKCKRYLVQIWPVFAAVCCQSRGCKATTAESEL